MYLSFSLEERGKAIKQPHGLLNYFTTLSWGGGGGGGISIRNENGFEGELGSLEFVVTSLAPHKGGCPNILQQS